MRDADDTISWKTQFRFDNISISHLALGFKQKLLNFRSTQRENNHKFTNPRFEATDTQSSYYAKLCAHAQTPEGEPTYLARTTEDLQLVTSFGHQEITVHVISSAQKL